MVANIHTILKNPDLSLLALDCMLEALEGVRCIDLQLPVELLEDAVFPVRFVRALSMLCMLEDFEAFPSDFLLALPKLCML